MIRIEYYMPSETPEAIRLHVCGIIFWFSYDIIVAYHASETGFVVCENVWSRTTGKHIAYLCQDRVERTDHKTFTEGLVALERRMADALGHRNNIELMSRLERATNEKENRARGGARGRAQG